MFKKWLLKEGKDWAYIYHVSPESGLYKLRPTGAHKGTQAHTQGKAGIYVAPKFGDALAWYISFVRWKKRGSNLYYRSATIYKIKIPKSVLERSWSANFWEKEYFISEDDLDQVEIVSQKTYNGQELVNLAHRNTLKSYEAKGKDPERIAKGSKGNIAAVEYLRLLEKYRNLMLNHYSVDSIDRSNVQHLFSKLEKLFIKDIYDWNSLQPISKVKDPKVVQEIVNQINNILDGLKRRRKY